MDQPIEKDNGNAEQKTDNIVKNEDNVTSMPSTSSASSAAASTPQVTTVSDTVSSSTAAQPTPSTQTSSSITSAPTASASTPATTTTAAAPASAPAKNSGASLGFAPPEVRSALDVSGGVPVLSNLDVQKILDENAQKLREWIDIIHDQEKGHISREGKEKEAQLHKELSAAMGVLAQLADQAGRVVQVDRQKAVTGLPSWAIPEHVRERHKVWLSQADARARRNQEMLNNLSAFFRMRAASTMNPATPASLRPGSYSAATGMSGFPQAMSLQQSRFGAPSMPMASAPAGLSSMPGASSSPYARLAPYGNGGFMR